MDELLQYLFGFWRFVFSRQFRHKCVASYKQMGTVRKLMELLGGITSISVGLGVPIIIVIAVYRSIAVNLEIDSCLDSGGSYSYEACACNFETSYPSKDIYLCW